MKITCELKSRETGKRITSTEIEADDFGANMNNPFPASVVDSVYFNSKSAIVTYRVARAGGEA